MDLIITEEEFQIAEKHGISRIRLATRCVSGWNKEEAMTKLVARDSEWKKWQKVAEKNGISRNTFGSRRAANWPEEEAATKPIQKGSKPDTREYAIYKGEELWEMGTLDELVEKTGYKLGTLQFMKSSYYQRNRNKTGKGLSMVCLDEEEDDAI